MSNAKTSTSHLRYTVEEDKLFKAIMKSNKDENAHALSRILKPEFDNAFPNRKRTLRSFVQRVTKIRKDNGKPTRKYTRKSEPKISVENRIKPVPAVKLEDVNFGNNTKMISLNIEISMDKLSKIVSMYFSQNNI